MENPFLEKTLKPMLIGKEQPAFDDANYLYELKLDGIRCLAYLDDKTDLRNKRSFSLLSRFPELTQLHKQVRKHCVLDGELYVYHDGQVDFFTMQRRALTSDTFKVRLASKQYPAVYTAFDILYYDDHFVVNEPLYKRKALLQKVVKENTFINISRYIEEKGITLYELTTQKNLEGIVAKQKNSTYDFDTRTKKWIKCKHLMDEDFVVCGYIVKDKGVVSLVLGQYRNHELCYKGHVTMGVSSLSFLKEYQIQKGPCPFPAQPAHHEQATWLQPNLVCCVKFMMKTAQGGLRQPVLKSFRNDKVAHECIEKK